MLNWGEFKRWMRQAVKTYEFIYADIGHEGYSYAGFKLHQAAGLALKALLNLADGQHSATASYTL